MAANDLLEVKRRVVSMSNRTGRGVFDRALPCLESSMVRLLAVLFRRRTIACRLSTRRHGVIVECS